MRPEDTNPAPTHDGWRPQVGFAAILLGITALLAWDLVTDRAYRSVSTVHLVVEGLAAFSAMGAATWVERSRCAAGDGHPGSPVDKDS